MIVSVPVRAAVVSFATTLNDTVPLPFPDPGLVIVIHEVVVAAVHVQPVAAVTVTESIWWPLARWPTLA